MNSQLVSGLRKFMIVIVIGITTADVFGLTGTINQLPDTLINKVYDRHICTVWLGSATWEFSMPVIEAGSDQQLELRFDDLSGESRSFGYTLVHCDASWKRSQLSESEYLSGFGRGTIREARQSFNTTYFYINYRLAFPEADCLPVLSGNYALIVYNDSDPDEIILTRRFFVTENAMTIEASARQPAYGQPRQTGQQVLFSVLYNERDIRDPQREISAVVIQNNRFDKMLLMNKPYSVQSGRLDFNDPDEGIFSAGNEFRTLDIKSMRYQTENVAAIEFRNPYYHVVLKPDKVRANKPYFSKTDLNGSYYIDKEKADERHIEADYVYVHFNLESSAVYSDVRIYVTGAFNDWKADESSLMKLNPENGLFEITLLMKQGLYDYCFFMKNPQSGLIDEYETEGSFYETENDYTIFVYFHDQFKRFDRLTGYLPIK